jgi:DNA-binding MarR family transcriptional regulator
MWRRLALIFMVQNQGYTMDLEQIKILSTLSSEKKSMMIKDIAELSEINRHTVARKLDTLEILGRVRKIEIGNAKNTRLLRQIYHAWLNW